MESNRPAYMYSPYQHSHGRRPQGSVTDAIMRATHVRVGWTRFTVACAVAER